LYTMSQTLPGAGQRKQPISRKLKAQTAEVLKKAVCTHIVFVHKCVRHVCTHFLYLPTDPRAWEPEESRWSGRDRRRCRRGRGDGTPKPGTGRGGMYTHCLCTQFCWSGLYTHCVCTQMCTSYLYTSFPSVPTGAHRWRGWRNPTGGLRRCMYR
jgi:hypothetical protein